MALEWSADPAAVGSEFVDYLVVPIVRHVSNGTFDQTQLFQGHRENVCRLLTTYAEWLKRAFHRGPLRPAIGPKQFGRLSEIEAHFVTSPR
jgi:hypothetical protein